MRIKPAGLIPAGVGAAAPPRFFESTKTGAP